MNRRNLIGALASFAAFPLSLWKDKKPAAPAFDASTKPVWAPGMDLRRGDTIWHLERNLEPYTHMDGTQSWWDRVKHGPGKTHCIVVRLLPADGDIKDGYIHLVRSIGPLAEVREELFSTAGGNMIAKAFRLDDGCWVPDDEMLIMASAHFGLYKLPRYQELLSSPLSRLDTNRYCKPGPNLYG